MWYIKKKNKKQVGRIKRFCGGVLLAFVLAGAGPMNTVPVQANSIVEESGNSNETVVQNPAFEIEADVLLSDRDTYNIQVTVKNSGADWEGIVRVVEGSDYGSNSYYGGPDPCAYDTVLSLPQGSEKQFGVKLPKGSGNNGGSNLWVMLLDKDSNIVSEQRFERLLLDEMESLTMGILSDEYASLTYLDMGGATMYYYNSNLPVKLVDMTQNNLVDSLDSLTMLVIDEYNTEVLTDEETKALALWIDKGGVLIVGTGAAAEETLSGLEDVLPAIKYVGMAQAEDVSAHFTGDSAIDVSQLRMAVMQAESNQYYDSYFAYGVIAPIGDGAVGIVPYSLVELGRMSDIVLNDMTQEQYVLNLLEEFSSSASSRYNKNTSAANHYENMSQVQRMLGMLGNTNNTLQFGILKFLIILYVIFVGPVLYLILRVMKKRDLYWVSVPITAVVGIIVVFFAGRGFEVASTRVYSVTTEDLTAKQKSRSYLYCYDANYKEWNLQLADGYEYAGPLNSENYHYSNEDDPLNYYYHVQNEGGRIALGIKPSSAFEDSFFCAGKENAEVEGAGSLDISDITYNWSRIDGTVSNNTNKNFAYFAVIANDTVYVYENLPAGGTCSLGQTTPVYSGSTGYDLRNDYLNNFLKDMYDGDIKGDLEMAAALGIGLKDAYPQNDLNALVVCGVTDNWDKVIDDNCSEVSYGCYYTVQ